MIEAFSNKHHDATNNHKNNQVYYMLPDVRACAESNDAETSKTMSV